MTFSVFCSIGSISLGVMAWLIPCFAISKIKNFQELYQKVFFSFFCCILALVLQLLEINYRVQINDLSAVMDTIAAVVFAAVVLVIGTGISNGLAYYFVHQEAK